ncbi:helix-turn-helix domain-containing protein [Streptomyces sp. HNM0574]|uniref:PucR family transcriptional regulator n=1 Tax=Streptomyces sp. HNM0574 TaxID=2714954 RepID=UPI003216483A
MQLTDSARELALRCEPQINALARRMARETFETLPGYASIPGDMKDLEIAATARHGMRLFMRHVRDPDDRHGGSALFRERAAQRAEEGVPLHLLLRTHSRGVHVLWQALREAARPGEETALAELTELLFRAHEKTVSAVAETYLDEQAALDAERREHRRSLTRALLDGTLTTDGTATEQLAELGLAPEAPCLVLALTGTAPAPPATGRHPSPPVGERRALRRLQTALDHAFGVEVAALHARTGHGRTTGHPVGHAVVPQPAPGPDGRGQPALPDGLLERLRRAGGDQGLRVAAVPCERPHDVAQAAGTAREILRVARAAGHPPGLHTLEDVLLEFHLSRPGASGSAIAQLLDPLDDRPELLETLRVHLEQRRERRGTARHLGVHPNTVDNRLARAAELTGLDLTAPRGATLALAALLLRATPAEH